MIKRLKVAVIYCKKCNSAIWSSYQHDFVSCDCGACFIDGGGEYTRYGGDEKYFELREISLAQNVEVKTNVQYVAYVNHTIGSFKQSGFFNLYPPKESKGYTKIKEVIEWLKEKILQLFRIRK